MAFDDLVFFPLSSLSEWKRCVDSEASPVESINHKHNPTMTDFAVTNVQELSKGPNRRSHRRRPLVFDNLGSDLD